jgi:hypothetical protein
MSTTDHGAVKLRDDISGSSYQIVLLPKPNHTALLSGLALTALPTLLVTSVLLPLIVLVHVFLPCATEE